MTNPLESPSAVGNTKCVRLVVALLRIAGGASLVAAVFLLSLSIVVLLLYEFVLGDDHLRFMWVTSLPISAVPTLLALLWYADRLVRGAGIQFVIQVTVFTSLLCGEASWAVGLPTRCFVGDGAGRWLLLSIGPRE